MTLRWSLAAAVPLLVSFGCQSTAPAPPPRPAAKPSFVEEKPAEVISAPRFSLRPPEPVVLDASELEVARAKLPSPPSVPDLPKLRRQKEVVNRIHHFAGTDQPCLAAVQWTDGDGKPRAQRPTKVAVISAGNIPEGDRARKYVSDALYAELQRQSSGSSSLQLVDRDYAEDYLKEQDLVTGNRTAGLTDKEKQERLANLTVADYLVYVHIVEDNHKEAQGRPEEIALEPYIDDADWDRYQASLAEYERRFQVYQDESKDFNAKYRDFVTSAVERIIATDPAWARYEDAYTEYEREYAKYKSKLGPSDKPEPMVDRAAEERYTLKGLPTPERTKAPPKDRARFLLERLSARLDGERGLKPVNARAALLELPRTQKDVKRALGYDDEGRGNALPVMRLIVYRFAISLRVVDARRGAAVWFGLASAQNLTYLGAVDQVCRDLVTHLVGRLSFEPATVAPGKNVRVKANGLRLKDGVLEVRVGSQDVKPSEIGSDSLTLTLPQNVDEKAVVVKITIRSDATPGAQETASGSGLLRLDVK